MADTNKSETFRFKLKARVVIYFILGLGLLTVALLLRLTAPGRVDKMLGAEELKLVSEEKRKDFLEDGYTEVITFGKYEARTNSSNIDGFLYLFKAKDMDAYFAVNLSKDDSEIGPNCKGLQIFCKGELEPKQIKISGEVYETLYTEDVETKVYDWPGDTFETAKGEKLEEQYVIALCVTVPGVLLCLLGLLSLFFVRKKEK